MEASQLRQQLLDEVLRTGEGAENTGSGGSAPGQPRPSDPGPLFFLLSAQ